MTTPSLFRPDALPEARGLRNTGVICHFNSLLQALLACTSAAQAVLGHRAYFARTLTGRALHTLYWHAAPAETRAQIEAAAAETGAGPLLTADAGDFGALSALVLRALVADLRARRPGFAFGPNQESASEGLILLIDMTDVGVNPDAAGMPPRGPNPLAEIFYHRYRATVLCRACRRQSEPQTEVCVQIKMFGRPAATPEEFADKIVTHYSPLEDYRCEMGCAVTASASATASATTSASASGTALRVYQLELLPEIVVCVFGGAYLAAATRSAARPYFPPEFRIPGADGGELVYREVAQVEHFGSLGGGHYVAQALRRGAPAPGVTEPPTPGFPGAPREVAFNDDSVSPGRFGPESGGYPYLVFYHRTE